MAAASEISYSLAMEEKKTMNDSVVRTFDDVLSWRRCRAPIITVYKHPVDYPTKYVARLFDLEAQTPFVVLADTLHEVRKAIPARFIKFPPDQCDDSHIIEVYI